MYLSSYRAFTYGLEDISAYQQEHADGGMGASRPIIFQFARNLVKSHQLCCMGVGHNI